MGENSVAGAVVVGDQTSSLALQSLIADRVDIGPFRNDLLQAGESLPKVIQLVRTRSAVGHG